MQKDLLIVIFKLYYPIKTIFKNKDLICNIEGLSKNSKLWIIED